MSGIVRKVSAILILVVLWFLEIWKALNALTETNANVLCVFHSTRY